MTPQEQRTLRRSRMVWAGFAAMAWWNLAASGPTWWQLLMAAAGTFFWAFTWGRLYRL